MNPKAVIQARRGRFDGMWQIVRYNWPQYVGGLVIASLGSGWWWFGQRGSQWLRMGGLAIALLTVWWCLASLVASFWIYDVSLLYRWTWIPGILTVAPRRWLNLHAGLDESSSTLHRLFPGSEGRTGDFYDSAEMSEPSIERARAAQKRDCAAGQVSYRQLPFTDELFDTVFLLFAAHELRRASSRETLMQEVRRVLSPSGTVLLVEHVRDLANFAAFGPGFLHFMPGREWRRLAKITGLDVIKENRMTPFVKVILLRKKA